MNLRDLKKEVESLASIEHSVELFQKYAPKLIQPHTNIHLPSLQVFSGQEKKEFNQKIGQLHDQLPSLKARQALNEKLHQYARYLIELKLSTFNQDQTRFKTIASKVLKDEFLNLPQAFHELSQFQNQLQSFSKQHDELNEWLNERLTLEEQLLHAEQPHHQQVRKLLSIAEQQKRLIKTIGQEFVNLAKEGVLKND